MPDDSVRSHLEAIRDGHSKSMDAHHRAVAALRLLDEAPHKRNREHVKTHRLVFDPVCGASTENTP